MRNLNKHFKSFISKCKTPVIAGVLFLSPVTAVCWDDIHHPAPDYISITSGSYYSASRFNGKLPVNKLKNKITIGSSIYFSESIPVLSRFGYSRTTKTDFRLFSDENINNYENFFIELKSPFKLNLFSYDTRFFMIFSQTKENKSGKASENFESQKSTVSSGSPVSFGEENTFAAFAINTPITADDSALCYSRFGFYFNTAKKNNIIELKSDNKKYLIDTKEDQYGIFYEFAKPVLFDNFIFASNIKAALGDRKVRSNNFNIKSKDFKASKIIFFANIDISLKYNIIFSEYFYMTAHINYALKSFTSLTNSYDSEFVNGTEQKYGAGASLTFNL